MCIHRKYGSTKEGAHSCRCSGVEKRRKKERKREERRYIEGEEGEEGRDDGKGREGE